MPVVSGLEALKLYRFSTAKPIPILILSANVTTEVIAECDRAGAQEFIAKPLRASILLDAVERHAAQEIVAPSAPLVVPKGDERPPLAVVDTPVLDSAVIADLSRLSTDATFVDRLLDGYRCDVDRLVLAICDALAARRYDDVKDAAHALKGGSASVGAMQLFQIATRLDKASHDNLRMRATAFIEELREVSARTLAEVEACQDERRAGAGEQANAST